MNGLDAFGVLLIAAILLWVAAILWRETHGW